MSPEPVLTPEIAGLARAVADRYGGTLADVLRLAIPPRHARAEAAPPGPADAGQPAAVPAEDEPDPAAAPAGPAGETGTAAASAGAGGGGRDYSRACRPGGGASGDGS